MKIRVDEDRCSGHGRCYTIAPDVYEPDDEGHCVIRREDVAPEFREIARRAALNCPEDAITITEEN
jgi:ferredoxin